jgi:hypothetical protein
MKMENNHIEALHYTMEKLGFIENSPTNRIKNRFNLSDSNVEKINNAQISLIKYGEENDLSFTSYSGSSVQVQKCINCNGEDRKFTMFVSFLKEDSGDVDVKFTMSDSKMPEISFDGETPEAAVRGAEEKIAAYGIEKLIEMAYWEIIREAFHYDLEDNSVIKKLDEQQGLREEMTAPKGPGM